MLDQAFDLNSVPSLADLITQAEGYLLCVDVIDVRKAFWLGRFDETVTMSEDLAQTVALPSREDYRLMDLAYKAAENATLPCVSAGFISWTCCESHLALSYANMLLRAIAYGYNLSSEWQPRPELWWKGFNEVTA